MNKIIVTENDFTRSKKQLKKALKEEGFEVPLSKSGQLLAKTFGYKDEHEFQQNLLPDEKEINVLSKEERIIEFYFSELLCLYKRISELLTFKIHFKINNTYQLDSLIECKSRISMFIRGFEAQKQTIITGEKACYPIMVYCARLVYNTLVDNNYNYNFNYLNDEELIVVKHLYNYHNIEPWMLKDKKGREEYYLKLADFESELGNDRESPKGNISFTMNPIILERYDPETGVLYTRGLGDVGMSQKNVGFDHKDDAYVELHGAWEPQKKFIKIM